MALLLWSAAATARTLTVRWDKVPSATKYELSIRQGDRAVREDTIPGDLHRWKGELPAGFYYYSVRGIDRFGRPGKWTPAQAVAVPPRPPALRAPDPDAELTPTPREPRVKFEWSDPDESPAYLLEIECEKSRPARHVIPERLASLDLESGTCRWRTVATATRGTAIPPEVKHSFPLELKSDPTPWRKFAVRRRGFVLRAPASLASQILDPEATEIYPRWLELAVHGGPAPYQLDVRSPRSGFQTSFRGPSASAGAAAEWRVSQRWALAGQASVTALAINGTLLTQKTVEALIAYRRNLRPGPVRWVGTLRAGPALRELPSVLPVVVSGSVVGTSTATLGSWGLAGVASVQYFPRPSFSIAIELGAFYPISPTGLPSAARMLAPQFLDNVRGELAAQWWLSEEWSILGALSLEHRGLTVLQAAATAAEDFRWLTFQARVGLAVAWD